jgi:hypothetical protein
MAQKDPFAEALSKLKAVLPKRIKEKNPELCDEEREILVVLTSQAYEMLHACLFMSSAERLAAIDRILAMGKLL